jgi:hypothetical protein
MRLICWGKIDNRIHFPHSDVDIVMGGPYKIFSSTNCLLSIHKKMILDMDAAIKGTHPLSAFKCVYGNRWEPFQHT